MTTTYVHTAAFRIKEHNGLFYIERKIIIKTSKGFLWWRNVVVDAFWDKIDSMGNSLRLSQYDKAYETYGIMTYDSFNNASYEVNRIRNERTKYYTV